ncbi:MAG TPA: alpha/beta hydrolase [Acidimicrobiales bacterium]|nr:alpha/beta hydrolase [Acidimicrobiales bacterium]
MISGDGVAIAAHDLDGSGPDLLLAHATGFHGHVWLPVARHLRSRFTCVAFDERGHGDSGTGIDESFDWHRMAEDALAVVDALCLSRPFGVGHSCGAALLLLAEEHRPGTFGSLYCFEPIVAPVDDPPPLGVDNPMPELARRRREVFPSRDAAYRHFAEKDAFRAFDPDALRAYVDHGFDDLEDGTVRLSCRGENEARVYEKGLSHRAFRHLDRVRCPVTLAYGEHSDRVGRSQLERLAGRLSNVRIDVVAGVGHLGPMEDPQAVGASVLAASAALY